MTVSPRYGDYAGVFDTGLIAPVEVCDRKWSARE
jgi:hypothetical protein